MTEPSPPTRSGIRKWGALLLAGLIGALSGGLIVGLTMSQTDTTAESVNNESGIASEPLSAEMQCQDEMAGWLDYLSRYGNPAFEELAFTYGAQSLEATFLIRLFGDMQASALRVGMDQTFSEVVLPRIVEFCGQRPG